MRKIVLILILLILVFIQLQISLKIPFDKEFLTGLINGILSNLVIFFVGIFVIDKIIKNIEKDKLSLINKEKSFFFKFKLNIFALKLLQHLQVISVQTRQAKLSNDKGITFNWVMDEFQALTQNKSFIEIVNTQLARKTNKQKYLQKLSDILKDDSKGFTDQLKEIYPHYAPDVYELTQIFPKAAGFISGMATTFLAVDKANEKIVNTEQKIPAELFTHILTKVMISDFINLNDVFVNLKKLSARSENNDLFIK
ncbi:MAG: hypothetical protein V4576_00275 [Patescibacteria group bacterium]